MFGKRLSRALAATTVASLVMTAAVFADTLNVQDLVTDGNATAVRSGGGSAEVYVAETGSGGSPGCDLNASNKAVVGLTSNQSWLTFTSPASVELQGCGTANAQTKAYAVSGSAPLGGTAIVSGAITNSPSGNFNQTSQNDFSVTVVPRPPSDLASPSQTTSSIDLTWSLSPDDGDISNYQLFSAATAAGPFGNLVASPAPGTISYTHSGLSASTQVCYTLRARFQAGGVGEVTSLVSGPICASTLPLTPTDITAPVITPNVSGTLGKNDWYTSDVTVTWSVMDNESAISSSSGCGPTTINADTDGTTLTCTATSAGGTNGQSVTIKRDATTPTLSPSVSPNPVVLNGSATASANASDVTHPGSGLFSSSCDAVDTSSVIGNPQSVTCYAEDNAGNTNSASATYSVIYDFNGFFRPIDNKDTAGNYILNSVKAGSSVPIKFTLGGDQGFSIFATGFPASKSMTCGALPVDALEEIATPGSSGLSYDSLTGQYTYVWKTDKNWAGSCRTLHVKFADGQSYYAAFKLQR